MSTHPRDPSHLVYQPFWCEENIWRLCQDPALTGDQRLVAVITGSAGHVAIWNQRAAPEGQPVAWDYHVIVLIHSTGWQAGDLDTRLPCPAPADVYLDRSFPLQTRVRQELRPRFRVLPAADYVAQLSSDRSHMRSVDGSFQKPPPPWPPPGQGTPPNLARFIAPDRPFLGDVLDLDGLRRRLVSA